MHFGLVLGAEIVESVCHMENIHKLTLQKVACSSWAFVFADTHGMDVMHIDDNQYSFPVHHSSLNLSVFYY